MRVARALAALVVLTSAVVGCGSPEANRTRGGGPGADIGNRRSVVRMHEGSVVFYQTPRIERHGHPDLGPARQAQRLSRRGE